MVCNRTNREPENNSFECIRVIALTSKAKKGGDPVGHVNKLFTLYQIGLLNITALSRQCLPLPPLFEDIIRICCCHGLDDVRSGHETHEGQRHDKQGTQDEASLGEG